MRTTPRLNATVKSAARYLEAYTPTGLTGLNTHPSPRPALLYTYHQTLQKLKQLPASSVYRQSCEALTKQRLKIVEETKPPGYAEWLARVQKVISSDPAYKTFMSEDGSIQNERPGDSQGNVIWNGVIGRKDAKKEGSNTKQDAEEKAAQIKADVEKTDKEYLEGQAAKVADLEMEPALTADQIDELEQKLSAGLIEEVVDVAENELDLVDEMIASRAWEDLEEKAPPGQWEYFDRGDRV